MAIPDTTIIPEQYKQPSTEYEGRIVHNTKELVTYSSTSHIRIWYNNQSEGYEMHSHDALEVFICIQNNYEMFHHLLHYNFYMSYNIPYINVYYNHNNSYFLMIYLNINIHYLLKDKMHLGIFHNIYY